MALAGTLPAAEAERILAIRIDIPERGEVTGYLFVVGTNKFRFINPRGWKPEGKVDRREIVFIAPDLDASLTLRILEGVTAPNLETARERLAERFANATPVHEFRCYAAGQTGWGFELEQAAAENSEVKIRCGMVPLRGGMAEVVLRGPASRMEDLRFVFGRFMASFQVERPRS